MTVGYCLNIRKNIILSYLFYRKLITHELQKRKLLRCYDARLRIEFTMMLVGISTGFVCLNLPYCVIWLYNLIKNHTSNDIDLHKYHQNFTELLPINNLLYIAKTIFYVNYCANFFLYCVTGSYYRTQIKKFCFIDGNRRQSSQGSSATGSTLIKLHRLSLWHTKNEQISENEKLGWK